MPYVFYAVPATNPAGPATVFTDRFWEEKEEKWEGGLGIVYGSMQPYFGIVPDGTVGPLVGTPDEWLGGLDYDRWIAGGYPQPNGCIATGTPVVRVKLQTRLNIYEIGRGNAIPQAAFNLVAPQTLSVPAFGAAAVNVAVATAIVTPTRRALAAALNLRAAVSQLARVRAAVRLHVPIVIVSGRGFPFAASLAFRVLPSVPTDGADGLRAALNLTAPARLIVGTGTGLRSALQVVVLPSVPTDGADGLRAALNLAVTAGPPPPPPGPGHTCATGGTMVFGTTYTFAVASPDSEWMNFPVIAGSQYHFTYAINSGTVGTCDLFTGTCASPSPFHSFFFGGTFSFTATSTGNILVECNPALIGGPGNVSITAFTGP